MKNTFSMKWSFSAKQIFAKNNCKLLLYANLTKFIDSLYLTLKVNFIHQQIFSNVLTGKSFQNCMFKLTLQIGLYDQNLVRKKRTLISNYVLCFCAVYKVGSVYCTINNSGKSNGDKEDFDFKSGLT